MVAERRPRTSMYCGPLVECSRRELPGLELRGGYVAERKYDGAWCAWYVDHAGARQHRFESRVGLEFSGTEVDGLANVDMGAVGKGTILVGELEVASEAATRMYRRIGHRRIHLFDVIAHRGEDVRGWKLTDRMTLLRLTVKNAMPRATARSGAVLLAEQVFSGFAPFYDYIVSHGGEGIVVKPLSSAARPTRSDGKTPEWIRCKPWTTVDYVVCGPARTEKGELSAKLGLWRDGRPRVVLQCGVEGLELTHDGQHLVQEGSVVELYGREVMASGALRHATFLRYRPDKRPEECTGERVLLGEKPAAS